MTEVLILLTTIPSEKKSTRPPRIWIPKKERGNPCLLPRRQQLNVSIRPVEMKGGFGYTGRRLQTCPFLLLWTTFFFLKQYTVYFAWNLESSYWVPNKNYKSYFQVFRSDGRCHLTVRWFPRFSSPARLHLAGDDCGPEHMKTPVHGTWGLQLRWVQAAKHRDDSESYKQTNHLSVYLIWEKRARFNIFSLISRSCWVWHLCC